MFSNRLNTLFESSERYDRRVTQAEMADALTANGHRISRPYQSQLRRGARSFPSPEIVAGLADFFGVDEQYFFLPAHGAATPPAVVISRLHQAPLRILLTHADALCDESKELVLNMADKLRRAQNLPARTAEWIE